VNFASKFAILMENNIQCCHEKNIQLSGFACDVSVRSCGHLVRCGFHFMNGSRYGILRCGHSLVLLCVGHLRYNNTLWPGHSLECLSSRYGKSAMNCVVVDTGFSVKFVESLLTFHNC